MNKTKQSGESRVEPDEKRADFRIGLVALLVALGTGIVSYLQYRAAEEAIRISHEDSVKTMRLSYRPYVGVQCSLGVEKGGLRKAAKVTLHFNAMGSSPALDAVVRRRCTAADTAQRQENGFSVIVPPADTWNKLNTTVSHSVLFPGNSVDFHCVAYLDSDPPPPYVFVVGDVTYKDVFGDGHKTTFCFETSPDQDLKLIPMYPCSTGNEME